VGTSFVPQGAIERSEDLPIEVVGLHHQLY
jgi:hypothetical protein